MPGTRPAMTTRASGRGRAKKKPAQSDRSFQFKFDQRRSKLLVRSGGRLVHGVLGCFLGVADGLLALAFDFLDRAFALQPVGTDGFTDALLGLADGFVGGAFNLVCRATHGTSPRDDLASAGQVLNGSQVPLESSTMTGSHDHTHSDHSHDHDGAERWKHDGVRVIPGDQLDPNVPSTAGMDRKAAINFARVGAQKLWAGTVTIKPDAKTGAHHHGHLESIIYVVRGKARMRWGEHLQFMAEANPGDFIFIPPYVPHQEINASPDQVLECVRVRSDGQAVAINLDIEPVEKPETVLWVDPVHRDPAETK